MNRPRVLLVEDDASVCRFVAMALDDLAIELVQQDSVAGALAWLAVHVVDLVLTDLTLVDGSAMPLVDWLAHAAPCPVAVFSAGVTPEVQSALEALKVWRILHKPVSLAQLRACVTEGLALQSAGFSSNRQEVPQASRSQQEADAVKRYFGGNRAMFIAYEQACRKQFALDVQQGDRAVRMDDLAELRRLAHSLKTVLTLLGYDEQAGMARMLDQQAKAGDGPGAFGLWAGLRNALEGLGTPAEAAPEGV